jgi:hypothetical protein
MGWFEELGDERCDVWLQVGLQGIGSDGTAPAPFLRLMLLYLAICQHWRQSVALPTGSVRNQPRDAKQAAAVRAALQQLLTPSCCSEMVQRVAPAYWAVAITQKFPKDFLILTVPMREDLGAANISQWLRGVSAMAEMYQRGPPCWALGEGATATGAWESGMRSPVLQCQGGYRCVPDVEYINELQYSTPSGVAEIVTKRSRMHLHPGQGNHRVGNASSAA